MQYIESWLRGNGCVPLYGLMEDAATAEICRAQLWQWIRHGARTNDGRLITEGRFDRLLTDELDQNSPRSGLRAPGRRSIPNGRPAVRRDDQTGLPSMSS